MEEVDLTPGAINYVDITQEGILGPLDVGGDVGFGMDLIQVRTDRINDAFMVNKLQRVDNKDMTAEEVRARTAENMKILGPTFGRLQGEFLNRLISRVINVLQYFQDEDGNSVIPEPPESLQGRDILQLKFVSPLARAQKNAEIQTIMGTIGIASQWAQIQPQVLDNVDFDEALRRVADLSGSPAGIIKDERKVAALRKQRQEAMAQQQAMAQDQMGATAVKDKATAADKIASAQSTLEGE